VQDVDAAGTDVRYRRLPVTKNSNPNSTPRNGITTPWISSYCVLVKL
jgi:hypothetical protein